MDVNVKSLVMSSLSIILYMQSKCIIQRFKTPILCNGSVFKFTTQFLRRIQEVSSTYLSLWGGK